jgi:hypothetical protein
MNARYLPSLSLVVMVTIGALGIFVVGFAYGYEADPAGPPPGRPISLICCRIGSAWPL